MTGGPYKRALAYLYDLQKYGIKFGLSSTSNLLKHLQDPHKRLRVIHVAGTNGKGSTAAMLSAILTQAGYLAGLYTSPHLVRFNERFRINEREVLDEEILEVFRRVKAVVDEREPPTFFEMTTAMALSLFAERRVDWAVLEVGMGGRLDATNVVQPRVTVINNVFLDHQEFLGVTLTRIAREKAGIIKEGVPLITAVSQPAALAVIKARCLETRAPCFRIGREIKVRSLGEGRFTYRGLKWSLDNLQIPLAGRHQSVNAATALGALEVLEGQGELRMVPEQIHQGLAKTRWSGRLELLSRRPRILLDGAHNFAGMVALCRALQEEYAYRKLIVVLGIMADKDLRGMLLRLAPLADHIILTKPKYERAAEPESLQEVAGSFAGRTELIRPVQEALERATGLAAAEDLVLVTGSLYFIGEVKEVHEQQNKSETST
ncbi:MAG: bifunctional folylpolyglutamate synthase/dihydrofolate synthase [Deltaproteobacteria bacterium]|nr:MAG: bifunctional folylpolyglutamate synthase/dihydrofolate synthase [Deltaproteobacteria bacterium]